MLTLGRSRALVLVLVGGVGAALLLALAVGGTRHLGAGGAAPVARPLARAGGLSRLVGARQLVPGASSRFSSTYRLGDGTMLTRVSSAPMNFRDSRGHWRAIDASLVARAGAYVNRAGAHGVRLPRRLSDGVQVSVGGARLSMRLLGADGAAGIRGTRARYRDVLPGVSAIYDSQPGWLREQLILSDRRAPARFVFALSASRGLQARQQRSGDIVFSRAGRQVFVLPASFAFAQGEARETHVVPSVLRRRGRGWTLTVSANRGWAHGALAHGPVVIDPTVIVDPDSQDCTIESDTPTTSLCTSNGVIVGYDSRPPAHDHRGLVQFDVSAVPRDAVVLNATMELYLGSHSTNNLKQVGAYPVVRPWTNSATWNSYDGTNGWSSAGAANAADASTTPASVRTIGDAGNDWIDWYPTKTVQGWVNGTVANHGFLIRDVTPNTTNNELGFASRENDGSHPNMEIEWAPRTGQLGSYTFDAQRLTDRASLAVNVANGNLLLSNADLHVAGTGLDLDLIHYHNSMGAGFGLQGVGIGGTASLGKDVRLQVFADGSVAYFKGDGVVLPFLDRTVSSGTASFAAPPDLNASLTQDISTGTYTLTFNQVELRELFNSDGQLTALKDRNDNTISLTYYEAGGGLDDVTDTQGRVFGFDEYGTDGDISAIHDPTGRDWSYTYGHDDTDYLTDYEDPAGNDTVYDYDSAHRLNTITTPEGNVIKISYDGTSQRVAAVIRTTNVAHTTGPTTSYAYGSGSPCTSGQTKTVVTDPNGHTTTYCANFMDEVETTVDAVGNQRATTYTSNGDTHEITDTPSGSSAPGVLTNTYDADNNMTALDDAETEHSERHYYTSSDTGSGGGTLARFRAKDSVDDQATGEFYTYDSHGNLTDIADAASSPRDKAHMGYNGDGTVASVTDGNTNATAFGYTTGNLTTITPPSPLSATHVAVDGLSRDHTVQVGSGVTATLTYDVLDRVTRVDLSDGSYFTYTYDADGNLTQRADSAGNTSSYTVDPLGRRTHEGLPGSKSNDYTYDAGGNLKTVADGAGTVTYSYDAIDRLSAIVSPTASGSSTDTISYSYDDAHRKSTMTLPGGTSETYNYSRSGKLASISVKNSSGTVLRSLDYDYGYASGGSTVFGSRVHSTTDQSGQKTIYTYKDATVPEDVGRLVKAHVQTSGGSLVEEFRYSYDKAGNRTTLEHQTPAGTTTTTYAYNAANELCWKFSGSSSNACGSPPSGATSYSFDGHGNETAAGSAAYGYDTLDRASSLGGTSASYLSQDNDELVAFGTTTYQNAAVGLTRQFATGATTNYVRDPSGQPVSQRTSAGKQFFLNDLIGSTVALTDSSGTIVRSYAYDPDGNAASTGSGATTDLRFAGGQVIGGVYHYGARYYDPSAARWTQPDSVANYADLTEANRYVYAGGDPINASDTCGTETFIQCALGCARQYCRHPDVVQHCIQNVHGDTAKTIIAQTVSCFARFCGGAGKAIKIFSCLTKCGFPRNRIGGGGGGGAKLCIFGHCVKITAPPLS